MTQGYVKVRDGVLFYESFGTGEPVIFIHGNYNDHQIWEEQIRALSASHYVIAYDLRGYGQSHTPCTSFSNVADLYLLITELALSKVTLIASSMGGSVAIDFALAYPDHVHRLILAAPSIGGRYYPISMLLRGIKQHFQVRLQGYEKAIESFITAPFWQYYFPAAQKEEAWLKTVTNVRNQANFCRFSPKLAISSKPHAIDRLGEIHQPVLIIIGELDHPFNRETAEILHREIKNAVKIEMPDCSHLPFIENPEIFSSYATEFLFTDTIKN